MRPRNGKGIWWHVTYTIDWRQKMEISYTYDVDILVIGGGAAGLRAAAEAARDGGKVVLCTKKKIGTSGSTFFPGMEAIGMNAINHPEVGDSEEEFFNEVIDAGLGAADENLARILVDRCTSEFHTLEEYGVEFKRKTDGSYLSVVPCYGRLLRGSPATVTSYRDALWKMLMQSGANVRTGICMLSLVVVEGKCFGAVGWDEQNKLAFFRAKATILATGGASSIYEYSLSTPDQTGDGYVMAYNSGASLMNLEFIQFGFGLTWPVPHLDFWSKCLSSIPEITNRFGKKILPDYLPKDISEKDCLVARVHDDPFSSSGIGQYLDIAMYEEWRKGNAMDSGGIRVRFDKGMVLQDDNEFTSMWIQRMEEDHVDIFGEGADVMPQAHCFNGGVYIGSHAEVIGIKGLFAAGEAAGGPHGANRLGGNAMAATQVFGAIAGASASQYAADQESPCISDQWIFRDLKKTYDTGEGLVDIPATMTAVRQIMWRFAGIVRSEERCREGLEKIQEIERTFNPWQHFLQNKDSRKAVDLYSYLCLSKMLLEIMRYRKESRGPHFRLDYPDMDPEWKGFVTIKKENDMMSMTLQNTVNP